MPGCEAVASIGILTRPEQHADSIHGRLFVGMSYRVIVEQAEESAAIHDRERSARDRGRDSFPLDSVGPSRR